MYPVYPSSSIYEVPIDYEQIDRLLIKEQIDVLLTPSNLIQFVKVRDFEIFLNHSSMKLEFKSKSIKILININKVIVL